jgi:hypothetical protein
LELSLMASLRFGERCAGAKRAGAMVSDEVFTMGTSLDHASEFSSSIAHPEASVNTCPRHRWACSV